MKNFQDSWLGSDGEEGSMDQEDEYGGGWDDEMGFTRSYSMLGSTYLIDLQVGIETDFQVRSSMSPSFIAADADASGLIDLFCDVELASFKFYGIEIVVGLMLDGDIAGGGVNGDFESGGLVKK